MEYGTIDLSEDQDSDPEVQLEALVSVSDQDLVHHFLQSSDLEVIITVSIMDCIIDHTTTVFEL